MISAMYFCCLIKIELSLVRPFLIVNQIKKKASKCCILIRFVAHILILALEQCNEIFDLKNFREEDTRTTLKERSKVS